MPLLFLGALLFAAAFAVLFFWNFKLKNAEFIGAASQRKLLWGCVVLSLSVAFLAVATQAFAFEAHWVAKYLSYALGASGLGLVLSGLAGFVQKLKSENERLQKAQRAIGRLVELGENFERAKNFRQFCDLIIEGLADSTCRVFLWKLSPDGKTLDFLAASEVTPTKIERLRTIPLEKSWFYQAVRAAVPSFVNRDLEMYNDYYRLFEPDERMAKAVFIPILIQGNTVGILSLFYPSPEPFHPEERALFGYLSTFLGSAFQSLLSSSYVARQEKRFRFSEKILGIACDSPSPEQVVPELFRQARQNLGADYLIFSVLEPKGLRVRRFTIGRSEALLYDKIPFRTTEGSWLGLPLGGHTICLRRSAFEPQTPEEKFLHSLGAKSYLFKASELPHRWAAGLAVAFERPPAWGEEEERLFHNLCEGARVLALRFQQSLMAEETERRLLSFVENSRLLLDTVDEKELLNRAGFVLTQELPVTFSRFWKLDDQSLQTVSFSALRDISKDLALEQTIPLADLPWHRMALDENRMMIVNEEDPEALMSEEEKSRALARRVQAAVLIPLETEGRPLGMVSLGEMRSWKRRAFSSLDLAFARGISNQVALSLAGLSRREAQKKAGEKLQAVESQIDRFYRTADALDLFSNLDFSINNPLTAIFGSIDLIRLKSENLSPETGRYLGIIEKQAERIHRTMQKVMDLKGTVGPHSAHRPAGAVSDVPEKSPCQ